MLVDEKQGQLWLQFSIRHLFLHDNLPL